VRSDQCDTVRVHLPSKITIGIKFKDDCFEARTISLAGELDFESELISVVRATHIDSLLVEIQKYVQPQFVRE
jgi:hypothetical protein